MCPQMREAEEATEATYFSQEPVHPCPYEIETRPFNAGLCY